MMSLGYGLVGLGGIARTHLQALKSMAVLQTPVPEVELAALLTRTEDKVEFGRKLGFARVEHTMDSFLSKDVDVVDICSPNSLHYEQILAVSQAGKHIYCEKPLGLNGDEATELGQKLAGYDSHIQGAFVMRFLPAVARARAIIDQGKLGQIHSFRFRLYHSSYLNPDKPGTWRLQHKMSGGGAMMDLGCHLLDLVRFMLGEAEDVQAWTNTVVGQRKWPQGTAAVDVDDHALAVLGLANGARGSVEVSRVAVGGDGLSLEVYGSQGAVHISPESSHPRCFDALGQEFTPTIEADPFLELLETLYPSPKLSMGWMVDSHTASLAWFFRAVATGIVLPGTPNLQEGIRTQLLVDAVYEAGKN